MRKIFISFCLLLFISQVYSQVYPFDSIPDNLRKRADAVIRSQQCLYTISAPGKATEKVKMAITLLNEESLPYRYVRVYYNKSSKVKYIKGAIYDEKGEITKVLGAADVIDMSAISGGSFYSDDRMKILYFPIYKYPYTIEYEYETEYSSILSYPSWSFHDDPDVSVERSGIQYVVPKNMTLRYFTKNTTNPVDSIITSDTKTYTWQEENLPVVTTPDLSLQSVYGQPILYTAPLDFDYGGYKGSMRSWKSFGEWVYSLNSGRDVLPESDVIAIKEVTSKASDIREKAKLVYEYMQSKTRYVSIQIGIGGFRTAEAADVSKNSFGDCKALVNYTMALMKAAGINSYYTLVRAGDNGTVYRNFVDNQFNHAILCIPLQNDTVWLDCTSQTLPFNYLGDFTDDRYALLITPEGGKMVRTPAFTKKDNLKERTGLMFMTTMGSASGTIINKYTGYNFGTASSSFGMQSEDEMKRYISSSLGFSEVSMSAVKYSEEKSEKPSAEFSYTISINDFSTMLGKRIYFNPAIGKLSYLQDFQAVLEIGESESVRDSVSYYLPTGYSIEYMPENIALENEFGKYIYNLALTNDKLTCKRQFEVNKGEVSIENFNSFRYFINKGARKDREQIVLTKD